ncbi:hypothetical protein ADUPG1_005222, partial [Aduncisulcus paluster]
MAEPELVPYVAAFREVIAANPDFGADETVGRLFLSGLRNRRLKDRIRSEADTAGKEEDLGFFMAQSFIELSEMIQIRDEVIAHYDDFGLQMVKKKRFGDRQSLEAESGKGKKHFRKDRNGKPYQTDGHYQKPKPYYAGDKTG